MWQWLVETLRTYPGNRDLPDARARLLGRQVEDRDVQSRRRHQHAARRRARRPARDHDLAPREVHVLSHVPVRRGLRGRPAVLPRPEGRRPPAGAVRGPHVRRRARHRGDRGQVPRLRRRRHGGPAVRRQHDLGRARRRHRQHQPARHRRRARRRRCSTPCRSPTPSPISSARRAPPGSWRASGRRSCGVDIAEESRKYEAEMGGTLASNEDRLTPATQFVMRAYRLGDASWIGRTVREFEESFGTADGRRATDPGIRRAHPPGWPDHRARRPIRASARMRYWRSRGAARSCWPARRRSARRWTIASCSTSKCWSSTWS